MPSDLPLRVSCAVITDSGKVFAARRKPGTGRGGKWEFPGGKQELNESPEDCLLRELHEEFSWRLKILRPLDPVLHRYTDLYILLSPFLCIPLGEFQTGPGHDAAGWFSMEELAKLDWSQADRAVLEKLRRQSLPG